MNNSLESYVSTFSAEHVARWDAKPSPIVEVELADSCIDELYKAAHRSSDENFTETAHESLSSCIETADEIRANLVTTGAVIVDKFPVESNDLAVNRRAAGILSNLIAPLMAQDIKGTLLYDVIDEGAKAAGTVRRSKTNEEQPFHTDGPWHDLPPSIIGLFCIKPAAQGGYSQVSSLQYNISKLLKSNPEVLEIFESALLWNRMGQFKADEDGFNSLPVIQQAQDNTVIRHYVDYVKTGHELAGSELAEDAIGCLQKLETSLADNACKPFKLKAGQMQFVNNWTVAHARAGFDDTDTDTDADPIENTGRHLVRLWNMESATV